jgi:cytochrome c oxidase assembly protein subunit 15
MRNLTKWFVHSTTIGMLLVLLMGALVTNTDSGRGCGDDWPLCHGKFVPAYTIESLIEYSHRFVTGLVSLLLIGAVITVLVYVRRAEARVYVLSALFFTLVQAALGAMAVKWPQSSPVLALHFGISLLAFASTFLVSLSVKKWLAETAAGRSVPHGKPDVILPGFAFFVWSVAIYCYIVVYVGAFVRHTESYGGCVGWPLCNGQLIPGLSGATGIMFGHRLAAMLLAILIFSLYVSSTKQYVTLSPVRQTCRWTVILVVLQIFSGGFVSVTIGTDWYVLSSLIHALLISSLFAALSYLCTLTITLRPHKAIAASPGGQV